MPRKRASLPTLPLPESFYPSPVQFERIMRMLAEHAAKHNQMAPGVLDVMDHYIEERLTEWVSGWRASVSDKFHHALCYHSGNLLSDTYMALTQSTRLMVYPDVPFILTQAMRCALSFADAALSHTVAATICNIYNVLFQAQKTPVHELMVRALSPVARVASSVQIALVQGEEAPLASYEALLDEGLDRVGVRAKDLVAFRAAHLPALSESEEDASSTEPEQIKQVDGSYAPNIQAQLDAMLALKPLDAELALTEAVLRGQRRGEDAYLDAVYKYVAVARGYVGVSLPTEPAPYWHARQLLHFLFNPAQWAKLTERLDETAIAEQAVNLVITFERGGSSPFTLNGLRQAMLMVPLANATTQELEKEFTEVTLRDAYLDEVVSVLQAALVCHRPVLTKLRRNAALSKEVPRH